jgi:hypothetical protein
VLGASLLPREEGEVEPCAALMCGIRQVGPHARSLLWRKCLARRQAQGRRRVAAHAVELQQRVVCCPVPDEACCELDAAFISRFERPTPSEFAVDAEGKVGHGPP